MGGVADTQRASGMAAVVVAVVGGAGGATNPAWVATMPALSRSCTPGRGWGHGQARATT